MERLRYRTPRNFSAEEAVDFFRDRNWPVSLKRISEVTLVSVTPGSALECGDGRFDDFPRRNGIYGPRIFGGINGVMALVTGGDNKGLYRATLAIEKIGFMPGTHSADEGGCGLEDLWELGNLDSAIYPYEIELNHITKRGIKIGRWLEIEMKMLGGKHFRLNGHHREEGLRINPIIGFVELGQGGDRFRIDDWFLAKLGVNQRHRLLHYAEVVEKLKPDAAKAELIVPNTYRMAA